jgi:hypothetical protein
MVKNAKQPGGFGPHCLACDRIRVAAWREKNRESVRVKAREKMRQWRAAPENQEHNRQTQKSLRDRARDTALEHYGGSPPRCACCDERNPFFLTLDHIDGNGREHRANVVKCTLAQWLCRSGFPPGFQVLCYNCNCGRERNGGICPHRSDVSVDQAASLV